jgi:type I restriction enzyme S subunit
MMKYDTYKDSGVEWLGDIPKDWEIMRVKDVFNSFDHKRVPLSGTERGLMENPRYDYYGASGVIDKVVDYIFDGTFILIGEDGANLNTRSKPLAFLAKGKFWVNNHAHILSTKSADINYMVYALESLDYSMWISGAAQPKLTQENLRNVWVYVPPISEQKAIAQYLDTKTQAIDKKVGLLEKKIGHYKELRKSIINDAVTRGLDKDVELKGSEIGIDVPKHWTRHRLKDIGNLYSGLSGKSGDDFRQDDHEHNKGFIPFTNIAANTYIVKDNLGTVVVEPNESQNQVRVGDIFFLMSSEGYEDIGKSSVLDKQLNETYLNSFCKGYRLKTDKHNPHFINYLLLSDSYRQLLIIEGKGFTRINLKMEKVNNFFIHIPPSKTEQTEIAQYLDDKTRVIDTIVSNIGKQIDHLKELRKTLINEVVTGKIKVVK